MPLLMTTALPDPSIATQKLDDGHETDSRSPLESMLSSSGSDGFDSTANAVKITASSALTAAQKYADTHDNAEGWSSTRSDGSGHSSGFDHAPSLKVTVEIDPAARHSCVGDIHDTVDRASGSMLADGDHDDPFH